VSADELLGHVEVHLDAPGNARALFDGDARRADDAVHTTARADRHALADRDVALDRSLDDERGGLDHVGLDAAALRDEHAALKRHAALDRAFDPQVSLARNATANPRALSDDCLVASVESSVDATCHPTGLQ